MKEFALKGKDAIRVILLIFIIFKQNNLTKSIIEDNKNTS